MIGFATTQPRAGVGFRKSPPSDRVGFFLLLFLFFVVPLSQSLMNLGLAALVAWWLSTGNAIRDLRASPLYVKCFLLFSVFPIITIFTSHLVTMGDLIFEIPGAIKIGIVLLPVYALAKRRGGDAQSTVWIMVVLVVGGLLACIAALIQWDPADLRYPSFPNTGGPNHTSAYMVLVVTAAIGLAWTGRTIPVICSWVALFVSLLVLFFLRSLSAYVVMACVGASCVCILIIEKRYKAVIQISTCLLILTFAVAVIIPDADHHWTLLKDEINERISGDNKTSGRAQILSTALEIHDNHLWFGSGSGQFERATSEVQIRAELQKEGRNYDQEKHTFLHLTDGHSVWTHVLVERGLVGVSLVAVFFALSGLSVFRLTVRVLFRGARASVLAQLAFLSVATWTIPFVGGIATTTLHYEHGLVGLALLVWSISALEQRVAGSVRVNG